jgi:hypothetical protein
MCSPSFFAPEVNGQPKTISESQKNFSSEGHRDFLAGIEDQEKFNRLKSENKKSTER